MFFIRDLTTVRDVEMRISEFEKQTNTLLMIDGTSLDVILSRATLEEQFFLAATKAPSVCVCRCSPTQKAIITKKIGDFT